MAFLVVSAPAHHVQDQAGDRQVLQQRSAVAAAPARSDEYVPGSSSTSSDSAWLATDPKPSPSGVCSVGSCHHRRAIQDFLPAVDRGCEAVANNLTFH
jgi:hypothetical protein